MRDHLLVTLALCFLFVSSAYSQTSAAGAPSSSDDSRKYQISIAVSGNGGPDDDFNPNYLVYKKWPKYATRVLGFINYRRPRDPLEIQQALNVPEEDLRNVLKDLANCGMIQADEAGYRVTFAVFDDQLWRSFDPIMSSMASDLSAYIAGKMMDPIRQQYRHTSLRRRGTPFGVAAEVMIGGFALDELTIDALQKAGLISVSNKPQPDGRHYVVLSQSNVSAIRHITYGIHTVTWNNVRYATYGDNGPMNIRRNEIRALPDIAWNWRARKVPSEEIDAMVMPLSTLVRRFENRWFSRKELSETLPGKDAESWLRELTAAGLIEARDSEHSRVAFPVFTRRDRDRFRRETEQIVNMATQLMRDSYPELQKAYAVSNPGAQGVPLTEVLDLVYHGTYSMALEKLFARFPELGFSYVNGDLRYTGYAVVQ